MVLSGALVQDLKCAARLFTRRPLLHSVILVTYALGIGATTMIFSVVDGVLLRPLPYPNADRLVSVYQTNPGWSEAEDRGRRAKWNRILLSYPEYTDWLRENTPLEALGIYTGADYVVTGGDRPEYVGGVRATAGVFSALGVRPFLGRVFLPADDEMGAPAAVVLGHGLWQRRFGSDSSVVGQTMVIDDVAHRIVGVMPRGFDFPDGSDIWTTFTDSYRRRPRLAQFATGVASLRPGVSLGRARQEMELVADRLGETYADPSDPGRLYGVRLVPLVTDVVGSVRPAILLILAAVGLVLLISCANNLTLLLLRASERNCEMAVRCALGAGRRRLLQQMLTEALGVSAVGGLLGWLLAAVCLGPFIALLPPDTPRMAEIELSPRALLFGIGLSVLAGLIVGLLAALPGMGRAHKTVLGDVSKRSSGGRQRIRAQTVLVLSEVAVTFILLSGAGVLTKSFLRLSAVELGFEAEDLVTVRLDLRGPRYSSASQVSATYRELEEGLGSLPGAVSVATAGAGPFFGSWRTTVLVENREGQRSETVGINEVSPPYHRVLGIPLVAGRYFTSDDYRSEPPVTIVNENMARTYWPDESAVGRRLKLDGVGEDAPWYTVVGVVGDVRRRLESEPIPTAYRLVDYGERAVFLRTAVPPAGVMTAVRDLVLSVDPDLPVLELSTMRQRISRSAALPRVRCLLFCCLAGIAALLAVVGIFAVLAYAVAQRTNEIGIRIALGAASAEVVRSVVTRGLTLLASGMTIGLAISLGANRALEGFLFEVDPVDPATLLAVAVLLTAAATVASYLPARRAAKVDPVEALRRE